MINKRSIFFMVVFPNVSRCHPVSARGRKGPARMIPTPTEPTPAKPRAKPVSYDRSALPTLTSVLTALAEDGGLSANRARDLRSAVTRVAKLMGEATDRIALDLPMLSAKLAAVNPVAAGLSPKTFSNIRSDFLAAVN
jgi:hypothetical protein